MSIRFARSNSHPSMPATIMLCLPQDEEAGRTPEFHYHLTTEQAAELRDQLDALLREYLDALLREYLDAQLARIETATNPTTGAPR